MAVIVDLYHEDLDTQWRNLENQWLPRPEGKVSTVFTAKNRTFTFIATSKTYVFTAKNRTYNSKAADD